MGDHSPTARLACLDAHMVIASFVISALSLLVAAGASWFAWRSVREAKRSADAAAEMTAIDRERRVEEIAEAERNRVEFAIEQVSRDGWVLSNEGTDTAYGVHVDPGDLGRDDDDPYDFEAFPARHRQRYLFARAFGTDTEHVVVTWHHRPDRSDERQSKKLLGP